MKPITICVRRLTRFLVLTAACLMIHLAEAKRASVSKKIVRIEAFENCYDRPNTEQYLKSHNHIESLKIERIKMDQYITADYVVNRPVKTIQGSIQMLKCESKEPTTCEYVMTMKVQSVCDQIVQKNAFWSPLLESIHPTIKCPLTKQVHHISNGSFSSVSSTPFLTAMPGGTDSFWAIKFAYSDVDNVEAGCMYIVFKLYHMKVKQGIRNQQTTFSMKPITKCVRNLTWFLVLTAACLMIHLAEAKRSSVSKKIVRIEAFEDCNDRPNTEQYLKSHNHIESLKIERIKMDQYITADYVVNRPVKTIQGVAQILKCESKEPTTCEYFMAIKLPNVCSYIVQKNALWSPLLESIQPLIRCPLTKQVYKIINGSFSIASSTPFLTAIPGEIDAFWATKFVYSDVDNVEAGCMYIVFKLYQIKVKQ